MAMLKVRDKKTGLTREVTKTAYALLGPRRYQLITESPNQKPQPQPKQESAKDAAPVVSEAVETENAVPNVEVTTEKKKPGRKTKSISASSVEDEK